MKTNPQKIYDRFEENPPAFMAGAGALFMGLSKLVDSIAHYKGSSAYAKDVARRLAQAKLK